MLLKVPVGDSAGDANNADAIARRLGQLRREIQSRASK